MMLGTRCCAPVAWRAAEFSWRLPLTLPATVAPYTLVL